MKILNLYAGIGGNRKLWGDEHEITAIEYDDNIAAIYRENFPNDKVIVTDAHQFLLDNFREFDFIWSSPPCQSHSDIRKNVFVLGQDGQAVYPDLSLYEEIIFLQNHSEVKNKGIKRLFIVENVRPYYKPLINPSLKLGRHFFWSNFDIPAADFRHITFKKANIGDWEEFHEFDLSNYKPGKSSPAKRVLLRNCVDRDIGLHILESAIASGDLSND
jgi:DNA (cytosine-5)-methyltransferase 1